MMMNSLKGTGKNKWDMVRQVCNDKREYGWGNR